MQTRLWRGLTGSAFGASLCFEDRRSAFCWCVQRESGFSRREDFFTFNVRKNADYKLCTLNAICKGNGAVNCVAV